MGWAIVIGIDDYGGKEPTLQSAVHDAETFSRWLVDRAGVPAKQVKKLLGRRKEDHPGDAGELLPTKDNVLGAINQLMAESGGRNDALYFFFSGHGVTSKYASRDESALVFPGVDERHPVQTLAVRSIAEFFETTRFLDQFFFIDACRSPLPPSYDEIGPWQIPRRREPGQDPPQQFILYATAPGREAEGSAWPEQLSAFSKVLIPGLEGDGLAKAWSWERGRYEVRWERLATYVKTRMEAMTRDESGELAYPFQIPQDVGTRGVAGRDRDALLSSPRTGEVVPVKLTIDLAAESVEEADVTVVDAIGVSVATAVRVMGSQEFTLPPRTYAVRVTTPNGRVGHVVPPIELYDPLSPRIVWQDGDEDGPGPVEPYGPGTITIDSPDPLAVADVRDETGHVVGLATQEEGCKAFPGFYRVRLVGPERDKTGDTDLVLLRGGRTVSAKLPDPALDARAAALAEAFGGGSDAGYVTPTAGARPAAWAQPSTVVAAGLGSALHGNRTALDALGLERVPELGEGSGVAFLAVCGSGEMRSLEELQVRVWAAGEAVPEDEKVHRLVPTAAGVAAALETTELAQPYWVSIEPPGRKPTVVALRLLKGRLATLVAQVDSDMVRLYQFHPLAQRLESSAADSLRRLEHLQRQLLGGRLDGAEEVAERLAANAESDPFGGCLAGYVLLRLGHHEELGPLASTIIEAEPMLGDAYILRGEHEAYMQHEPARNQAYADAVNSGIPAFGEGLTRLVEGLRVSGFFHPRGALVRYIFQRHARGNMWSAFTPRGEFKAGRLVITGADIGYEG